MGPVGFEIYGMCCHTSGVIMFMEVVPNARCQYTVAHCYLDVLDVTRKMPLKITVDGGTEPAKMCALHIALREICAPEISFEDEPVFMALKIKISDFTLRRERRNIGSMDLILFSKLFNWVWSQIARYEVKCFKTWFNDQPTRTQHSKLLPSGVAPGVVLDFLERYSLEDCGIPIDHTVIAGLRAIVPKTRAECFDFVNEEFFEPAEVVYNQIGAPKLTMSAGWEIFARMLPLIEQVEMYTL
ncbi:hypothetical protein CPB85DRAFT_1429522 [Mucidula mucida]|nr:hypothetical protein CPB85DRAFT_1429522 [Mucidula mucida]